MTDLESAACQLWVGRQLANDRCPCVPSAADIDQGNGLVSFVPCVDGSGLARAFFTFCSIGRCSHVFGLLMRFTGPLAIIPSADQVPVNKAHSTMRWHEWVVLIAGSTGSALRAVRPPNLHITPVIRRDLVYRASATGSLYRSPLAIMAQTIRAILLASATAATLAGFRASKAVSQGRCLVPWILA